MAKMRKSLLLFEPNVQMQALLTSVASRCGVVSYICPCSVDPSRHAQRLEVDGAIIVPEAMPDGGITLLSRFRENPYLKSIPLLVITAQGLEKQLKPIKDFGCKHLLIKPFPLEKVSQFILDHVAA